MRSKQKGFTLIELLVVIALVALAASVVLISLKKSRVKARDTQRKADIAQVRKALEFYYNTNQTYPIRTAATNFTVAAFVTALKPYISKLPFDPSCASLLAACNYSYISTADGKAYGILIRFSNDAGTNCKFRTPGGTATWFSSATDCKY